MAWWDRLREAEVEPSLYAADFAKLGEQIEELLAAGARVFHYDVGDGHFVEPIIIGPIVLRSIGGLIHDGGGRVDVHLMVESPEGHFRAFREAGADSVTFHYEAVEDLGAVTASAREHGLGVGVALKPGTAVGGGRGGDRGGRRPRPLHEHRTRLFGPAVHAGGVRPASPTARAAAGVGE